MPSWKIPTPEQIDETVALLDSPEQRRYFFDRLDNPHWIAPLKGKEFFQNPPSIIRDEVKGTTGFPAWPESRYLMRMAPLAPENVLDVARQIPDTENASVQEDLLDIALELPAKLAVQLLPKAKSLVESPYFLIPEKLGAFVAHLARGGEVQSALDLARLLLAIQPDPLEAKKEVYHLPQEERGRFDIWSYEEILKKDIPQLVVAGGVSALELLCDLLESAIRLSDRHGQEPEDYSYIWRPAVEEHKQNLSQGLHGVRQALISSIRDAAEQITEGSQATIQEVVQLLERRSWHIFHRLALHLLRVSPDSPMELIAGRLTNHHLFALPAYHHEYGLLARACFARLPREEQELILGWGEKGPETEIIRQVQGEKSADDETVSQFIHNWRDAHFASFAGAVPAELRDQHSWLNDFEQTEAAEFVSIMTGFIGPTSPKSLDELRALSVNEIINELITWTPSSEFMSPSREGLGRVLTALVDEDPDRFVSAAEQFHQLHPEYVYALLTGFERAIKQKRLLSWAPILALCSLVIQRQPTLHGESIQEAHEDLTSSRMAIASLLSTGFVIEAGNVSIPFSLRNEVWEVLRPLTEDQDPNPDHERRYGGSNMPPAELAVNTVRGTAMSAVVRYALWVHHHLKAEASGEDQQILGFIKMPEVEQILDEHLDPERDPSLAIRAVYGQWLPWLVLLDAHWTAQNVSKIFPAEEALHELRDAAWDTYLTFCPAYDDVFDILREQYSRAIEQIETSASEQSDLAESNEQRLAQHLLTLYWRGKLHLDESDGLLIRFYSKASDALCSSAIEFIARSLSNTEEPVPSQVLLRLQSLWEWRMETALARSPASHRAELASFGEWFSSGKFDANWAVKQLREVLALIGKVKIDHLVIERLASVAEILPLSALECLRFLLATDSERWSNHLWDKYARTIVSTALHSSEPDAKKAAMALIYQAGTRKDRRFYDLLSSQEVEN